MNIITLVLVALLAPLSACGSNDHEVQQSSKKAALSESEEDASSRDAADVEARRAEDEAPSETTGADSRDDSPLPELPEETVSDPSSYLSADVLAQLTPEQLEKLRGLTPDQLNGMSKDQLAALLGIDPVAGQGTAAAVTGGQTGDSLNQLASVFGSIVNALLDGDLGDEGQ